MATQTGGGAPAAARIYRWEIPASTFRWHTLMILRHDDSASTEDAYVAQYWTERPDDGWEWCTRGGRQSGMAPTEDAARRACLLAVLHADEGDEGDEGGEQGQ